MSGVDQSDDLVDCPLCMEPLEVDDINFFPCTCGYQICRFCWHRIRTDENGLCPACRKAYPEDPADFKPLSKEEFVKIKAEKRHKNQQKKQKITENRKSLTNVRVVQRNLVFVLGLPARLADMEILKRHEYFGKFGKIVKVVINHSTSYAGSQAPCSSAYLTYQKPDDALRAIQAVNNITVDGRVLKSSLGTTKYCSHFLKNQSCPKVDCMYLHELGDPEASFTKEEMQQGKHQEFEKKLHDQLIQSMQQQQQIHQNSQTPGLGQRSTLSPPSVQLGNMSQFPSSGDGFEVSSSSARSSPVDLGSVVSTNSSPVSAHRNKHLDTVFGSDSPTNLTETIVYTNSQYVDNCDTSNSIYTCASQKSRQSASKQKKKFTHSSNNNNNNTNRKHKHGNDKTATPPPVSSPAPLQIENSQQQVTSECKDRDSVSGISENVQIVSSDINSSSAAANEYSYSTPCDAAPSPSGYVTTSVFTTASDNNSFFSSDSYPHITDCAPNLVSQNEWTVNNEPHMPDVLPPVQSSEDWQAAFGFASCTDESGFRNDDDLDFDPFTETQKALSEMLEMENGYPYYNNISNNGCFNGNYYIHNGNDYGINNNNNDTNNVYAKKLISMQPNNRIDNCSKLLSELCLSSGIQQRTTIPPPGFHSIPHQINNYNIGIPRSGNKLLPFAQQSITTLQHNDTGIGWDLTTSFDPSVVSAAAHRVNEYYGQQPPPGFPIAPILDAKYIFNNYI